MMKTTKKLIAVPFLAALLLCSCGKADINVSEVIGTDRMKVDYYKASYVIDETDLTQVTTYASYVFIADVVSYDRTEYLNGDGESPMTFYTIRVRENIKGSLVTDKDIELKKAGGLLKGKDSFSLCEGDVLPQPGKTYLFAPVIFADDLYCPMPNMVAELDPDASAWAESETVKQYKEALTKEAENVQNGNLNRSKYDTGVV